MEQRTFAPLPRPSSTAPSDTTVANPDGRWQAGPSPVSARSDAPPRRTVERLPEDDDEMECSER